MNKWIDINDRLPEKDTDVLVCFDDGFMATVFFGEDFDLWADSGEPIAWMPLPEPYKLPEKKEFSDDELCILRNIDKKYKWIARDESGSLCIFDDKPKKSEEMWDNVICSDFIELNCYNHLFNSIKWEDEEPIRIDEYVDRK